MVGFSWFLTRSSIQVQAWPVHQIRPNRGVGLRRLGPWDSKTSSSREVSRDSQRLRHWTPDEPVDVLLIKVDRRLPLVVSPASFTKQIADRHSRPLHSRSRLPLVVSHAAEGTDLMQSSPCLSFGSLLTKADRAPPRRSLGTACLPGDCSPPSRLLIQQIATRPRCSQFHILPTAD